MSKPLIWAWDDQFSNPEARCWLGEPRLPNNMGYQKLTTGTRVCPLCKQEVNLPHSHTKPEFDELKDW